MDEMLALSAGLDVVELSDGAVLVREGEPHAEVWILESGVLAVSRSGQEFNTISQPGAIVGEVSLLLGVPATATVTARSACRLRYAGDGTEFLADPAILREVAVGLAERLFYVQTYLTDLKRQYGESPGLAMVPEVIARLSQRKGPPAVSGSRRDPDPEY
jgi:CRP-like cAMP-binding protein